ncbi:hypothetical protein THAR02_04774 [Trichoderma harzianum]|uniref:NACHT domain-containing protein n=1 Tax=Trichoderma harzianum TaxID=5544 RepID=A0A0F9XDH3_TRIHA|nr:hypothetical protein THAR02_04774 [Trichoderma harzianum]
MAPPQLSDPRQYTVGIITALDKELAAAMAVLDEKHRKPHNFKKHPKDTNIYTWGKIGEHNVVIASLAAGSYGTVSAATTASSMISSLPHIRFGLMVGIGAGVPRLADNIDIRLGDVVVSQPTGTSPGVVQYDLGKLKRDGKFERVGRLSAPPDVLLKGLQTLKAEHLMEDSQIPTILEDMVQRYPKMKEPGENGASGFIHQGIENDRLFMASSIHTDILTADGTASDHDSACSHCDSTQEIKRKDRSSKPAIHYGVIASGNLVVKDGVSRDEILQRLEEKCICFEMEAAGLMNNFPCLVIRGICDYADTHKNDRWQNYAAATAAAFAKELLNTIDGDDVESTPSIEEAIQHIDQKVTQLAESSRQTHTVVQALEKSNHLQKLREWLSPPNSSENYNNGIKHRHRDSGQWFLQSKEYSSWKSRRNSFLWLQGIPGCGKTVLSAIIVKDLEDNNVNNVLYFFFDFTNRDKRLFDKALGSLVLQLYCKNKNSQKPLNSLYDSCGKGITRPSADQLFETFRNMLQHAGKIHVILDALDECQMRKEHPTGGLLASIEALATSQQTNIRLLVTARPEQDITSSIESWARSQDIVPLQRGLVEGDILAYIKARVRSGEGPLKRWNERPEVQNEIETRLSKEANGMFRWVTCQLDALENCFDYATLQKALNSLPTTLDETYARILTNLRREHEHHARRLLQFLAFSERPLTIEEAVDAMAVDIDTANSPRLVVLTVKTTVKARGNEEAIQELQLAHLSVKDYLLSNRVPQSFAKDFEEATARASIAQVCLAYLLELDKIFPIEELRQSYWLVPRSERNWTYAIKELRQSYWLAQYSARYWMDHAVVVESGNERVCALIAEFFSCKDASTICYTLYNPEKTWNKYPEWIRCDASLALYYASLGGSLFSVRLLLDKDANLNARLGRYGTPLNAAVRKGHDKVVRMLLNHGAKISSKGGRHIPLVTASCHGHDKVVQILLDNNTDVNAQGGQFYGALYAASYEGHDKVVQILPSNGAYLIDEGLEGTALQAAALKGHDKVVQILLDNNADVNAQGGQFGNALYAASYRGYDKIVQMLLDKGAYVNARGGRFGTALEAALHRKHHKIAQMLRDRGASDEFEEAD